MDTDIKQILSSLEYLAREAKRCGFLEINRTIRVCMLDIGKWAGEEKNTSSHCPEVTAQEAIVDIFIYACNQFMQFCVRDDLEAKRRIRQIIAHYGDMSKIKLPDSLRKVN